MNVTMKNRADLKSCFVHEPKDSTHESKTPIFNS